MAYASNSPLAETVLRLEARKSLSLALWFQDQAGRSADITGSQVRIIAKRAADLSTPNDSTNIITNSNAVMTDAAVGYVVFELQASDLAAEPGEYHYDIIVVSGGYSFVAVSGTLELIQNTDYTALGDTYLAASPPLALIVQTQGQIVLNVRTGPTLTPGAVSFMATDEVKLDGIEPGAQVNVLANWDADISDPGFIQNKPGLIGVPPGGSPGEALIKRTTHDSDVLWAQLNPNPGTNGLSAVGVAASRVPLSNGLNSWAWELLSYPVTSVNSAQGAVVLDLDDLADTGARLALTPDERVKIAAVKVNPAWGDITGKPAFGTAALQATSDFLPATGIGAGSIISGVLNNARVPTLANLRGVTSGTTAPAGGADGDFYFQYSA